MRSTETGAVQPKGSATAGWSMSGTLARLGAFAAAYVALAWLGLRFAPSGSLASPIWPPTGLAIAFAVLWGPRVLPAVLAGAFAAEFFVTGSWGLAAMLAVGNTAEAALGGWLVRRAGGAAAFETLPGVLRFAAAALTAPLPAATAGIMGLAAFAGLQPAAAAGVWWTWYLGDAAGALVIAPVILLSWQVRGVWIDTSAWPRARAAEAAANWVVLVAAAVLVFGLVPGFSAGNSALVILLMPPLVWMAYRLGPAIAALGLLALDALAVAVTASGAGPFRNGSSENASFLVLQAFIFTVGLMALGLAALASERRRAALDLESRVVDRTRALEDLNARLSGEVEERRRAQAQVDEAQRTAQMGTWRWDLSKPRAEWSPELFRIYGLDGSHVPTYEDYLTRVHPGDVERVKSATEAVLRQKQPYSHDERVRRPDGSWRHLHTWAEPVTDADGKVTALVGACQDITDRVAHEHALQESLERFRALADASPIGIAHTRADGAIDYVNERWRQITGVRDHEDPEAMRRSVHPEDQAQAASLWRTCVKEGGEFSCDLRFVHADGALRWARARAVPVRDAAGALTGFVSALADITDQRAAEAKDREVRRLREQAEFKTNFLRTAAHELGTPLTPIKIQMRILRDLLKGGGREDERKAAEILERNIGRLHVLVQDMLESARLQSGRLRLTVRPMDMAQVVHEVVETFQEPAIQRDIALDTLGPHEMPMQGDPDRLSQVLYNLLSNAMKFTPPGGQIHVRLARDGPDAVRVTVQDTGAGFTPEQAKQLFQPFIQLHDPPERTRSGSGLGLYISRGIVEQHGGRMACESEGPGKGATFSFTLPRVAPEIAAPFASEAEAPAMQAPVRRFTAT